MYTCTNIALVNIHIRDTVHAYILHRCIQGIKKIYSGIYIYTVYALGPDNDSPGEVGECSSVRARAPGSGMGES